MQKDRLRIERINKDNIVDLHYTVNGDEILRIELGMKDTNITSDNMYETVIQWMNKTNSISYCIMLNDSAIGMISISHINEERNSARCGYWLASKNRGRGYTTEAFKLILDEAGAMGISELRSTIEVGNKASLAIWKRYAPTLIDKVTNYEVFLKL